MRETILKKVIKISNQRLLVPFYHMVSDDENTYANYLYNPRKIADFKRDLETFLKYYQPVSLKEFKELSSEKEQLKKNYFHVTFDDGLANFYHIVAPILEKKKITATVFINTDFVDNKKLFFRYKASLLIQEYENSSEEIKDIFYRFLGKKNAIKEKLLSVKHNEEKQLDSLAKLIGFSFEDFLKIEQPYLTKNQIKDLIKRGFTIGAHSKNHPIYSEISLEEQLLQTKESLQFLQENFNLDYNAFSFPFTGFGVGENFFKKLQNVLDISFGTSGIKRDNLPTNFQRISFEISNNKAESFLLKAYLKYLLKILFGKHIMPRN